MATRTRSGGALAYYSDSESGNPAVLPVLAILRQVGDFPFGLATKKSDLATGDFVGDLEEKVGDFLATRQNVSNFFQFS